MAKVTLIKCLTRIWAVLVLVFAISCNPTTKEGGTMTEKEVTGEELYVSYCQICHGEHGDGPMAELLKVQPPDMTQISARRGGTFPKEQIRKIVDGREEVKGHGSLDMPIWGKTFQASENLDSEQEVEEIIDKLVVYLESIQEEPIPQEPIERDTSQVEQ